MSYGFSPHCGRRLLSIGTGSPRELSQNRPIESIIGGPAVPLPSRAWRWW